MAWPERPSACRLHHAPSPAAVIPVLSRRQSKAAWFRQQGMVTLRSRARRHKALKSGTQHRDRSITPSLYCDAHARAQARRRTPLQPIIEAKGGRDHRGPNGP